MFKGVKTVIVAALITEQENDKIDSLVERGVFLNKSDFVRTAIRELLEGFSADTSERRKTE